MGLDSVALILEVEERFDISISNDEASTIATVGDIEQCVLRHLKSGQRPIDLEEVWSQIIEAVVEISGVQRGKVVLGARIVSDLGID